MSITRQWDKEIKGNSSFREQDAISWTKKKKENKMRFNTSFPASKTLTIR